jgi:hypothetical protein
MLEEIIRLGGGTIVVVGSSTVKNLDRWIRVQIGGMSMQRRRKDLRHYI